MLEQDRPLFQEGHVSFLFRAPHSSTFAACEVNSTFQIMLKHAKNCLQNGWTQVEKQQEEQELNASFTASPTSLPSVFSICLVLNTYLKP